MPNAKKPRLGNTYDLLSLYDRLNRRYFDRQLKLEIKWSNRRPMRARCSVELGSYHHRTKSITISCRLDNPRVPLYFLEHVIFHEMLHSVFPSEKHRMHTQKFRRFEKLHPDYERAVQWEKDSLHILFSAAQGKLWA